MATFRVGQRVRIVRAVRHHEMLGKEATIVGGLRERKIKGTLEYRNTYHIDIHGADRPKSLGWVVTPDQIEPLQPERNQIVAWEECLWQPPKVEEIA